MSWSVPYPSRQAFERDEPSHRPSPALAGEAREQFMAARAAVAAILATNALGGPDADMVVSITGHANPNHRPGSPRAPLDCVGLYIGQKVPQKATSRALAIA